MTNLAEAIQNACEIARQDERRKFKEYLEKKRDFLEMDYHKDSYEGNSYKYSILMEIIDELFGETEQDNSDRED